MCMLQARQRPDFILVNVLKERISCKRLYFIPNINVNRFTSCISDNKSLFDILRASYGIEIIGGEQKLRAILSDKKLSDYLRLSEGMPVLHLERRFDTSRPGYSIYSSIYCNTEEQTVY